MKAKFVFESIADVLKSKTSADIINSLDLLEDTKQFLIDTGCSYVDYENWFTPPTRLILFKTKDGVEFYVHKNTTVKELIESFKFYHIEIPKKYK